MDFQRLTSGDALTTYRLWSDDRASKFGRHDKLDSGEAFSGKAVRRFEASILSNVVITPRPNYTREHKKQGAAP